MNASRPTTRYHPSEFEDRQPLMPTPVFVILLVLLCAAANLFSLSIGTKKGYELGRAAGFAESCRAPNKSTHQGVEK